jgi:hypothetical protein
MKRMKNLQQLAIDAVRAHLREVAPEMAARDKVWINVQIEVDVRCSVCGCTTGSENPDRIAQLRCWWCAKESKKAAQKARQGVTT